MRAIPTLALAFACACGGAPPESAEETHEHGEEEVSDLDLPVDQLLAATCEHGIHTYTCDECRYEVGVARVPQALIEDGLLALDIVTEGPTEAEVALAGELRFEESGLVRVAAPLAGVVREVRARPGIAVARNEALFVLESAELSAIEGEHQAALASLDLAERAAARQEELRGSDASSEREYREAMEQREAARIRARVLAEQIRRLGLPETTLAEGPLGGRLVVTAPIAGVSVAVDVAAGERVESGEVAVQIGDPTRLRVEADVYEADLAEVLARQAAGPVVAEVGVGAFPGERFPGTLEALSATMDPTTRTVKARIGVPNADSRLRPGMFADVTLRMPGEASALLVPRAAVLADEGRSFVFLRHEGEWFVRRPVEPVGRSGDRTAVRAAGLHLGDTVVADGCFLLKSDVLRSKMGAGCAD